MGSDAGANLRVPAPGHLLASLLGIAGARRDGPGLRRACRGSARRRGRGGAQRGPPGSGDPRPAAPPQPRGRPRRRPPARGQPEGSAWSPGASPGGATAAGGSGAGALAPAAALRPSVGPAATPLCCGVLRARAETPPKPSPVSAAARPVQPPPGAGRALSFAARPRLSWLNCLCSAKRDKSGLTEGGGGIDIVSL